MNEQYSMKELRPLSLMEKQLRVDHKISEVTMKRNPITQKIAELCSELAVLKRQISGQYLPDQEYKVKSQEQSRLLREKVLLEREAGILKQELLKLNSERDSITLDIKKIPSDKAMQVVVSLRDKYLSFAADTTRVSSMRAMASKFVEEIQTLIPYLPQ